MASFLDGVVHLLEGPWLIIEGNRDTMGFETHKESTDWMWKVLEVGSQMGRAVLLLDKGLPIRGGV